jgi:hypothetical protein
MTKCDVCKQGGNLEEHNFFEMIITLCDECFEQVSLELEEIEKETIPDILHKFGAI